VTRVSVVNYSIITKGIPKRIEASKAANGVREYVAVWGGVYFIIITYFPPYHVPGRPEITDSIQIE